MPVSVCKEGNVVKPFEYPAAQTLRLSCWHQFPSKKMAAEHRARATHGAYIWDLVRPGRGAARGRTTRVGSHGDERERASEASQQDCAQKRYTFHLV